MISFKPLEKLMKERGMTKTILRHKFSVNINQLDKYLSDGINGGLIDNICRALNCQPSDIMEYIPDEEKHE